MATLDGFRQFSIDLAPGVSSAMTANDVHYLMPEAQGKILPPTRKGPQPVVTKIGAATVKVDSATLGLEEYRLQRMARSDSYPTTYATKLLEFLIRNHGERLTTLALE